MNKFRMLSIFIMLTITGCATAGVPATPTVDAEAMAQAAAATVFAHFTETSAARVPTPSQTPTLTQKRPTATSTSAPIPPPVKGVANSNVTVRSEPRKGADNLGGLFFNHSVQVIARNDAASWYYIEWEKSPTKRAWVLANAIDLKDDDIGHLPIAIINSANKVIVLPPLVWVVTGPPLQLLTPSAGAKTALLTRFAKVRVGPGVGYLTMGTLDVGTRVVVTGHIDGNDWLQIEYPSGLDGRGWVAGELAKMESGFAGLPFYNLLATPISDPELKVESTADPNATLEPTITPKPTLAGPTGEVIDASELNVRSGPASSFELLGTLKLGDPVVVTGLTLNRLWYQIVYPDGPGGRAWVSPKYIKITGGDMTKLPYFNDLGTPLP
jgi:uncharacterized protein YraI